MFRAETILMQCLLVPFLLDVLHTLYESMLVCRNLNYERELHLG